jgi:hypothetical protein
MLKRAILGVCVFILYLIVLNHVINSGPEALFGAIAATVLTVFLYTKLARRAGV